MLHRGLAPAALNRGFNGKFPGTLLLFSFFAEEGCYIHASRRLIPFFRLHYITPQVTNIENQRKVYFIKYPERPMPEIGKPLFSLGQGGVEPGILNLAKTGLLNNILDVFFSSVDELTA